VHKATQSDVTRRAPQLDDTVEVEQVVKVCPILVAWRSSEPAERSTDRSSGTFGSVFSSSSPRNGQAVASRDASSFLINMGFHHVGGN
jgi:hypothetical protein